jgi:hypothetical protein
MVWKPFFATKTAGPSPNPPFHIKPLAADEDQASASRKSGVAIRSAARKSGAAA